MASKASADKVFSSKLLLIEKEGEGIWYRSKKKKKKKKKS